MRITQDEVNQQEDSEQNEVDGMKKGADSTGKVMHMWKSGWWFVMRKIRMVEPGWPETGWLIDWLIVHALASPPTQYRFLQVTRDEEREKLLGIIEKIKIIINQF